MNLSEALQNLINSYRDEHNCPALLDRWHWGMETQVNVSGEGGTPVEGKRHTYTNGDYEWWNIRVPKHAMTDPVWHDYPVSFPLGIHVEGIGMTGWEGLEKVSKFVGYDFDAITGHAKGVGITGQELERVRDRACELDFVETRRSTSGGGLHLYVPTDDIPTDNHNEHAALARAILGMMSDQAGFDFAAAIDCCGQNMWFWHRKMTRANGGLGLIKSAERKLTIDDIPADWRDRAQARKTPRKLTVQGYDFEEPTVELSDIQKDHIEAAHDYGFASIWNSELKLWQTHPRFLQEYTEAGQAEGLFATLSEGRDPATPSVFCYPQPGDWWAVYRFNEGEKEHSSWRQDGKGYTRADFNRPTTPETAAAFYGGVYDHDEKSYWFKSVENATKMHEAVSGEAVPVPEWMAGREATVHVAKDRTGIITTVDRVTRTTDRDGDEFPDGWKPKGKKKWQFHSACPLSETSIQADAHRNSVVLVFDEPPETGSAKELGHWWRNTDVDSETGREGWWGRYSRRTLESKLTHRFGSLAAAKRFISAVDDNSYHLAFEPFQPEIDPARRTVNIAAQLRHPDPSPGDHPYTDLVINHVFRALTEHLDSNWCQKYAPTPYEWAMAWIAYMFQKPAVRMPYLAMVGPENSGKSTFAEMLEGLMLGGACNADKILSKNATEKFDGHLAGKILVRIEEVNIASKPLSERVKNWVTGPDLNLRGLYQDEKRATNYTHFIQCANSYAYLPIFGDATRFVVLDVPKPEPLPAGVVLENKLADEVEAFTHTVLNWSLPKKDPSSRFHIPVPNTGAKQIARDTVASDLEQFIAQTVNHVVGPDKFNSEYAILMKDFRERFKQFQEDNGQEEWRLKDIKDGLPARFTYRDGTDGYMFIYNAQWKPNDTTPSSPQKSQSKSKTTAPTVTA